MASRREDLLAPDAPPTAAGHAPTAANRQVTAGFFITLRVGDLRRAPLRGIPAHQIIIERTRPGLGPAQPARRVAPIVLPAGVSYVCEHPGSLRLWATLDASRYRFADVASLASKWAGFVPGADDPLELYADALRAPFRRIDPRLLDALSVLSGGGSASFAASAAQLSASRLCHLFDERFGTPPRLFRTWLLLRRAAFALVTGESVTRAAHVGGFADTAHLSRTCARLLGAKPSEVAAGHTRIVTDRLTVLDCRELRTTQPARAVQRQVRARLCGESVVKNIQQQATLRAAFRRFEANQAG